MLIPFVFRTFGPKRGGGVPTLNRLPNHPRRHASVILHDRSLQRVDQYSAHLPSHLQQNRLTHQKPLRPIPDPVDVPPHPLKIHPNPRSQAAKQHPAGPHAAPKLFHHRQKMLLVPSKVQHGVTQHHIREPIRKRHSLNLPNPEVLRWQTRRQNPRQLPYMIHTVGIRIQRKYLAPHAQQVHQIPPKPAAGIQNRHPSSDISAQDLVKNINVDLPELLLNRQTPFARRRSITIGGTSDVTSPPRRNTPLMSRELTYVYFSAGIINSVSRSGSSLRFIIAIWNSYS